MDNTQKTNSEITNKKNSYSVKLEKFSKIVKDKGVNLSSKDIKQIYELIES